MGVSDEASAQRSCYMLEFLTTSVNVIDSCRILNFVSRSFFEFSLTKPTDLYAFEGSSIGSDGNRLMEKRNLQPRKNLLMAPRS